MSTVRMQRGPMTFQWRPCVIGNWQPRPMNRARNVPQVLDVTGVPEGISPADVMRRMEATAWSPDTTTLTSVAFEELGLGRAVCASLRPGQASLKDASIPHTAGEVTT